MDDMQGKAGYQTNLDVQLCCHHALPRAITGRFPFPIGRYSAILALALQGDLRIPNDSKHA
jgi:hypothetical protein